MCCRHEAYIPASTQPPSVRGYHGYCGELNSWHCGNSVFTFSLQTNCLTWLTYSLGISQITPTWAVSSEIWTGVDSPRQTGKNGSPLHWNKQAITETHVLCYKLNVELLLTCLVIKETFLPSRSWAAFSSVVCFTVSNTVKRNIKTHKSDVTYFYFISVFLTDSWCLQYSWVNINNRWSFLDSVFSSFLVKNNFNVSLNSKLAWTVQSNTCSSETLN